MVSPPRQEITLRGTAWTKTATAWPMLDILGTRCAGEMACRRNRIDSIDRSWKTPRMRHYVLFAAMAATFPCLAADNTSQQACDSVNDAVGSIRLKGNALHVAGRLFTELGVRDEFTSRSAYEERAVRSIEAIGVPNGQICFRDDESVYTTYDADTQKLRVHALNKFMSGASDGQKYHLVYAMLMTIKHGKGSSYIGTNAFGVTANVRKGTSETVNLAFPVQYIDSIANTPWTENSAAALHLNFDVQPEVARSLKNDVTLVYQVEITPPYYLQNVDYRSPTLSSPNDREIHQKLLFARLVAVSLQHAKTGALVATIQMDGESPRQRVDPVSTPAPK